MFDFEFCLDTSDSKPVYCRQPSYGIHERKIMNTHIQILEDNDWICDCEGSWGLLLLLVPKPHQEGCTNINNFVQHICVSYRPFNGVAKSFEYPISRCSDSIEDFGDFSGKFYFISLNVRSGYHQIRVRKIDQENLAFFTLDGENKTFKVIPFGPKNTPAFYTTMIQFLRGEWIMLFNEKNILFRLLPHQLRLSVMIA